MFWHCSSRWHPIDVEVLKSIGRPLAPVAETLYGSSAAFATSGRFRLHRPERRFLGAPRPVSENGCLSACDDFETS